MLEQGRQKRKLRTIGLLMLASQILLLVFVGEWLRLQYREQERRLDTDLRAIFAVTEQKYLDSMLDQAVAVILKNPSGKQVQGMEIHVATADKGHSRLPNDSLFQTFPGEHPAAVMGGKPEKGATALVVRGSSSADSKDFPKTGKIPDEVKKVLRVALLQTADAQGLSTFSLANTVDARHLKRYFSRDMEKKNYHFPLRVDSAKSTQGKPFSYVPEEGNAQAITVLGYSGFLAKSLLPQAGFSILLLLLTAAAFWLAYRNMRQQRRFSEQKDSLISNISHELKTPVATTKVALEALQSFNALEDPVRTQKYLNVAAWEMNRLEHMIERALNLMQTDSGDIALNRTALPLAPLIHSITDTLQPILAERKIILHESFPDEQLVVHADAAHLTGAVYNILDNAIKYGGDRIHILLEDKGNHAVLTIADNGHGIDSQYQKKIFERFFRVPSGNRHNVKGHGLGLSYSRYIAVAHNGSLSLESQSGQGATFILSIPKHNAHEL